MERQMQTVGFGAGGVAALQELAQLPRWPATASELEQAAVLREDARIRDDFTAYGFVYDNRDLDALLGFFADDCVIDGPRGTIRGVHELRGKYRESFASGATRHIWSNVLVRVLDPASEAYLGAYHHTLLLRGERSTCATGTDVRHLQKMDGDWKIASRWLTIDTEYEVAGAG